MALSKEDNCFEDDAKVNNEEQKDAKIDNGVEQSSDSGGVFFSDEDDFNKLKQLADEQTEVEQKTNQEKQENQETDDKAKDEKDIDGDTKMIEITVTDGTKRTKEVQENTGDGNDNDKSGGVFFSDSDEFEHMKVMVERSKNEETEESGAEGDVSVSGNSSGYYFSDSDEFKKAKELAEVKDENLPLFEKDASETDDYEMTNVENDNAVVGHEPESEVGGHKTEKKELQEGTGKQEETVMHTEERNSDEKKTEG